MHEQTRADANANSPTQEEKTLDCPTCLVTAKNFLACHWHPLGPAVRDCLSYRELLELKQEAQGGKYSGE